jgi:dTDP-glucose 4,6-dehydratase
LIWSSSKAGSDLIALGYRTTFGLPVVVTRSSNNYGPFQFPEKVIPLFITNLLNGGTVPVYGDGQNVRDWIYVMDNCAGVDTVLRKGLDGEVCNIGGGNELSNMDLTRMLIELCGRDESAITYVEDRLGHDFRYSVDCSKARALGWDPSTSVADGLAATVAWYRDNDVWWRPKKG